MLSFLSRFGIGFVLLLATEHAQASIKSATDRQNQSKSIAQTMLDQIEGINNDEVATKILALQTALQASYQTTSQLYQLSLVKYLPPA